MEIPFLALASCNAANGSGLESSGISEFVALRYLAASQHHRALASASQHLPLQTGFEQWPRLLLAAFPQRRCRTS